MNRLPELTILFNKWSSWKINPIEKANTETSWKINLIDKANTETSNLGPTCGQPRLRPGNWPDSGHNNPPKRGNNWYVYYKRTIRQRQPIP